MKLQALPPVAAREDVAEQLLGLGAVEEVLLVGRALVGVAGRDGDAVDADDLHLVEEVGHPLGIGALEQGAVDRDLEALGLGQRIASTAVS